MLQLPENCPEPFEAFTGNIETNVLTQLVAVEEGIALTRRRQSSEPQAAQGNFATELRLAIRGRDENACNIKQ